MPLDPTMKDALLGTYKNMVQQCIDQNCSGEDFDKMVETYNRLEELAEQHDDMNSFNGQVMQENLYGKLSDYYAKAITAGSSKQPESSGGGEYDDAALLKHLLDGLREAIQSIKDAKKKAIEETQTYDPKKAASDALFYFERNKSSYGVDNMNNQELEKQTNEDIDKELKEKPNLFDNSAEIDVLFNEELLIKPIQDLINLGEQEGMTLPRFLKIQIEKGLDKAADGTKTQRNAYELELEWAKANALSPYHIEKAEKRIELYDKLASASKFNIPNSKELSFENARLDQKYETDIIKWKEIEDRWEDLIWQLSFWSLSYCSFAPSLKPWSMAANPREATIKTQKVTPGIFKEKAKLFKKYFGFEFMNIFNLSSFEWKVKNFTIDYSQEYIEFLIKKVYPECRPFNDLSSDTIKEKEEIYKGKNECNPERHIYMDKFMKFYDNKFGEGRFASKFSTPEFPKCNAKPWDFDGFKKSYS